MALMACPRPGSAAESAGAARQGQWDRDAAVGFVRTSSDV